MTQRCIGYLPRLVEPRPAWLEDQRVQRICSLSTCISADAGRDHGPRNRLWLYPTPEDAEEASSGSDSVVFGYRLLDEAWADGEVRRPMIVGSAAPIPAGWQRLGLDVVGVGATEQLECSPLSCNGRSPDFAVNADCLVETEREARRASRDFGAGNAEPGTYHIVEVWVSGDEGRAPRREGGLGHP